MIVSTMYAPGVSLSLRWRGVLGDIEQLAHGLIGKDEMRPAKILGLALVIVGVFAALAAASASAATPSLKFLTGEKQPIEIKGALAGTFELQNAAGKLQAKELHLTLTQSATETGILGQYLALFLESSKGATPCKTGTEAEGDIHLKGEWHLVLVFDGSSWIPGIWFLVPEFEVVCGATKIKIVGNDAGTITPVGKEVLTTETFGGALECTATVGEQRFTEVLMPEGTKIATSLLGNFGTGFKKSCESASISTLAPSKMLEIVA